MLDVLYNIFLKILAVYVTLALLKKASSIYPSLNYALAKQICVTTTILSILGVKEYSFYGVTWGYLSYISSMLRKD
jgi:sulfite exporter TauE/SafE